MLAQKAPPTWQGQYIVRRLRCRRHDGFRGDFVNGRHFVAGHFNGVVAVQRAKPKTLKRAAAGQAP